MNTWGFLTTLDWDTVHGSVIVKFCKFGIRNEGYITIVHVGIQIDVFMEGGFRH